MFQCVCQCGIKIVLPLVLQVGGITDMIATHLREAHYWWAITCYICRPFASMLVQIILENHSGCKVKLHQKKSKVREQEKVS